MAAPIDPRDRLPRFPAKPAERLRVPPLDHDLPATAWAGPRGQWTAVLVAPERRSHSPSVAQAATSPGGRLPRTLASGKALVSGILRTSTRSPSGPEGR